MMLIPLTGLLVNDAIALYEGPQRDVNYIGSAPAIAELTLSGTGQVRIENNIVGLAEGPETIPNPSTWKPLREIKNTGITQINLPVLSEKNWIRVVVLTSGTGMCGIRSVWSLPGSVIDPYKSFGLWNASTNEPQILDGIGERGAYYLVKVGGTTAIDGINNWIVGDLIIFNGSEWIKQPNEIVDGTY